MKTSELTGAALDWAVVKCLYPEIVSHERFMAAFNHQQAKGQGYCFSRDWAQGGPIIERERICLRDTGEDGDLMWEADDQRDAVGKYRGPTPLIAAMRCYVASVLGDEVDVPEELQ